MLCGWLEMNQYRDYLTVTGVPDFFCSSARKAQALPVLMARHFLIVGIKTSAVDSHIELLEIAPDSVNTRLSFYQICHADERRPQTPHHLYRTGAVLPARSHQTPTSDSPPMSASERRDAERHCPC